MKLLRIDSSPFGEAAISRHLTEEFVRRWLIANSEGEVITRDLTAITIPIVCAEWVYANYTPKEARTSRQNELLKLSTALIRELTESDECVIGMPMHNWGPPSRFKLWVDQIVTPLTKSTRPLGGKRVTFIIAAGGVYAPGSTDASKNHLVPWLRTVFSSLGVNEMQFVFAEDSRDMHSGKIHRASFLEPHIEAIASLFAPEKTPLEASTQ